MSRVRLDANTLVLYDRDYHVALNSYVEYFHENL
jgi:hypothetical protein